MAYSTLPCATKLHNLPVGCTQLGAESFGERLLGTTSACAACTATPAHALTPRLPGRSFKLGDRPPAPPRTFSKHWVARCEGEFQRAFYMFSASALPPRCIPRPCLSALCSWFA